MLYAHLDPADARELGDELAAAKIPFDVTPDGTTLRVPADQLDKARLETAAKGGPKSGRLGFELLRQAQLGRFGVRRARELPKGS